MSSSSESASVPVSREHLRHTGESRSVAPGASHGRKIDVDAAAVGDRSETLRESDDRAAIHRAILEAAVDAIICIDEHGNIESANRATERIFGYSEAELLGENVSMLMPQPYAGEHDGYIANYLRTGVKKIIGIGREVLGRRKDGTEFPVDLAVGEIYLAGRRAFTGIIRDISDRRQAAELLRKEQEFAAGIIDTAQAIVLVLDAESRILRFNPYLAVLTGIPLKDARGRLWTEVFLAPRVREENSRPFRATLDNTVIRGATYPIVAADGTERQVSWWATAMHDAQGEVSGILATGHDMTDLIAANRKLVQSERLAALGEAATRLAHESRNTLQRIQVAAGMARLEAEGNSGLQKQLDTIERASEEVSELLAEVRNFAAPLQLEQSPQDLSALWQEAWSVLDAARNGRRARLCFNNHLQSKCLVDRFRMEQVFRNLFENSLAACADPVQILVTAAEIDRPRRAAEIRIRDNGPGLSPEQRERIFEAFYTTKSKGTGLGMAIVRRIIEAHGGQIVAGDCSQGAEFVIQLPL